MIYKTGIGQDSHRFLEGTSEKKCVIAGLVFDHVPAFEANSDGDVVFHSICNAISTITGVTILGDIADRLCLEEGVTDSRIFLDKAMETLGNHEVVHVAISLEGKRPRFKERYLEIRESVATAMRLKVDQVGVMATTGEGLTGFGRGEGVQCIVILTVASPQ